MSGSHSRLEMRSLVWHMAVSLVIPELYKNSRGKVKVDWPYKDNWPTE